MKRHIKYNNLKLNKARFRVKVKSISKNEYVICEALNWEAAIDISNDLFVKRSKS